MSDEKTAKRRVTLRDVAQAPVYRSKLRRT